MTSPIPCVSTSKLKLKKKTNHLRGNQVEKDVLCPVCHSGNAYHHPPLGLAGPNYWHKQSRLGHWTMEMICSECLAISIMPNSILYFLEVFVYLHILCHHQAFMTLNLKLFEKLILLNNYVL